MKICKRVLSLVLVLVFVLGLSATAFAGLFTDNGYMQDWSDAQWAAADQWSADQWYDYYQERYAQYEDEAGFTEAMEQETAESDFLYHGATAEQTRINEKGQELYWEVLEQQWAEQEKLALGCPYADGINLKLNDSFLTFGDVRPQTMNNRTMVPFRAIFEALGASVSFDESTATATAVSEDGTVVSLTLSCAQLRRVDASGSVTDIAMDVAPYLDPRTDRILVPARFVAEALGYEVGWDEQNQIVYLYHVQDLIDEIDSQLTVFNSLLQQNASLQGKTYEQTGDVALSLELYGQQQSASTVLSFSGSGLTDGANFSADFNLKADLDAIRSLIGEDAFDQSVGELPAWMENGGDTSMIYNAAEQTLYVKSDLLAGENGWPDSGDTWVRIRLAPLGDELVASQQQMMQLMRDPEHATLGNLLYYSLQDSGETDVYSALKEAGQMIVLFYGDDAFAVKTSGSTTEYTLSYTAETLADRAVAQGMMSEQEAQELLDEVVTAGVHDFNFSMSIKERGGAFVSSAMSMNFAVDGTFPVTVSMQASSTMENGSFTLDVVGGYLGALHLFAETTTVQTAETVPTAPPAGDTVVDADSLYEYDLDGLAE